jgi:hypothetical protein
MGELHNSNIGISINYKKSKFVETSPTLFFIFVCLYILICYGFYTQSLYLTECINNDLPEAQ